MKTRQRIAIAAAAVTVLAVVLVIALRSRNGPAAVVASGTVEATEADLGFQVPGRIESIGPREGESVDSGAQLASLDRTELLARQAAAAAQVAAARAQLTELEAGFRTEEVAQGRAALRAAEQRLNDARRDRDRAVQLFDGGAVSQQSLDHLETAFGLAQAEYDSAVERLQILERGPRAERITAQRAQVRGAQAQLEQIEASLQHAVVHAPFSGFVSVRHREPGEIVQPGAPVLTVLNPSDRWVRIYVREDEVGRISIGQRARITADAYPDRTYDGEVVFIASEAEFTPRNVQTTEERVKLVYRVKVRITGDPSFDLKPGVAADVQLETDAG